MIQFFSILFILAISFIFLSPFLILFIKAFNRLPQSVHASSHRHSQTVEPAILAVKKSKRKKAINTNSSVSHQNPAIKEFTMPDGSKVAIDLDKVELEEKRVF